MTEGIIVALITQGAGVVIAFVGVWRKLGRVDRQTSNNHQNAEYPNLRDELTAVREQGKQNEQDLKALRGVTHSLDRTLKDMNRWLKDLTEDHERLDTTLDRKETRNERALAAAVRDRDAALGVVDQRLTVVEQTIASCPKH